MKIRGGAPGPTYHTVRIIVSDKELRDMNGTLIGQSKRTVTISGAVGVVPAEDDQIALGLTEGEASESSPWQEIFTVKPLSPAGTAVLYETVLVA